MEVKAWEYDEYPGLTEEVEGAVHSNFQQVRAL